MFSSCRTSKRAEFTLPQIQWEMEMFRSFNERGTGGSEAVVREVRKNILHYATWERTLTKPQVTGPPSKLASPSHPFQPHSLFDSETLFS
ncbi:hypothetical protein Tco_0622192 [Tanacetum coccineum]